jgi:hypothetical protein
MMTMKPSKLFRSALLAGLLSLLSLVAGAAALVLAEFGAPVWIFVILFAWLLLPGLPTLAAVLLLARFWPGPSFSGFLLATIVAAFFLQFGAVWGMRSAFAKRRLGSAG